MKLFRQLTTRSIGDYLVQIAFECICVSSIVLCGHIAFNQPCGKMLAMVLGCRMALVYALAFLDNGN